MNIFLNVLRFIGIINRHNEFQLGNVLVALIVVKNFVAPSDWDAILLISTLAYSGVMTLLDFFKRRGLYKKVEVMNKLINGRMTGIEKTLIELDAQVKALGQDYANTKNVVTLLNNKQVLTSFQQGLVNKAKGQTAG